MIQVAHAVSGCYTPPGCQVTVNSNVSSSEGTIWVEVDNSTGPYCGSVPSCIVPLPQTFNFGNNTMHSIRAMNTTFTGPVTQGHYIWKDWVNYHGTPAETVWPSANEILRIGPMLYNYTGSAGFTARFDKQYQYTLSFTDVSGNLLTPAPTSLTLLPQSTGTPITISSYTSQYLSADLYTATLAHWEGFDLVPTTSSQSIDLTNGPATGTISLRAYPQTIYIVDSNNSPVSGANVTITYVNSTVRSYISNSQGRVSLGDIPQGSFGATVNYQGQQYGPFSLTAVNNPSNTLQVNGGSSNSNTTTTAIVLLAIFGIAFFLILLAIKVRKPPGPPQI